MSKLVVLLLMSQSAIKDCECDYKKINSSSSKLGLIYKGYLTFIVGTPFFTIFNKGEKIHERLLPKC